MMGRAEEGTEQAERALELDPLNIFFQALYGVQQMMAGQHDAAITQFRNILAAAPGFGFAHQPLWKVLQYEGEYEEALVQAKAHFAMVGDSEVVEALELGYEEGGYRQAMLFAARKLAASSGTALGRPMNVVNLYDAAGETAEALEWLERAYEVRDIDMAYLRVLLLSEDLRAEPRFQKMLRRMNLPS
jgi:tetratricopeptide (TPR) repeat protein